MKRIAAEKNRLQRCDAARPNLAQYGSVSGSTRVIPRWRVVTAPHDVHSESTPTGRQSTAGPEWEITHLALDAARDDAPPTGAHPLRAELVQDEVARLLLAPLVLRGE